MRIKSFTVYKFHELSEEAKRKAIDDYITFLLETYDPDKEWVSEDLKKAVNRS
jgi:hypothetical protein